MYLVQAFGRAGTNLGRDGRSIGGSPFLRHPSMDVTRVNASGAQVPALSHSLSLSLSLFLRRYLSLSLSQSLSLSLSLSPSLSLSLRRSLSLSLRLSLRRYLSPGLDFYPQAPALARVFLGKRIGSRTCLVQTFGRAGLFGLTKLASPGALSGKVNGLAPQRQHASLSIVGQPDLIAHNVLIDWFLYGPFTHKIVNLFLRFLVIKLG